nr:MAG TPA: hypothetical protein [Ackermannviridae sp.]
MLLLLSCVCGSDGLKTALMAVVHSIRFRMITERYRAKR